MTSPQEGNQEVVRERVTKSHQYDTWDTYVWATPQERKLAEIISEVLEKNLIYGDDELRKTMAVLRKLGVKDTQHFSHITAEDLLGEGMPLVTARILMKEFGASGSESYWEW
ncbi:uncharacterized protein LOC144108850 isoform X2 [Amblyomma americanum]